MKLATFYYPIGIKRIRIVIRFSVKLCVELKSPLVIKKLSCKLFIRKTLYKTIKLNSFKYSIEAAVKYAAVSMCFINPEETRANKLQ